MGATTTADVAQARDTSQSLEAKIEERTRLLARAKQDWEGTFDAIVDPLAIVDRDFRIVRTNLALAEHAGRDVRQLSGQPCHAVLFGRDTPCQGCPVPRTFAEGAMSDGEVTSPERGRVYRLWSFPMAHQPERGRMGSASPDLAVCHYKDVTDEKELQRQLLQSEKMAAVGTLAGGVAHEMNNPVGAILAFTQLGLLDAEPGSLLQDYLREIESCALRCKRIVASLLDFSRPSSSERRPVRLREVIEESIFLCQHQFGRSGVAVAVELGAAVPSITADANQLKQVLINLLSNAYQALGSGGTITVRTEAEPGIAVRLIIEDDGPGIPDHYLPKLFEPFFTTKPEGQGTGLGLSVSYGIVKDHGGIIEVDSDPGQGATFTVSFPWPEAAGAVATAGKELET